MPIHREFDKLSHLLRTTVTGFVTVQDVRQHFGAVRRSGIHHVPEVIDVQDGVWSKISHNELLTLTVRAKHYFAEYAPARRAVVVRSDSDIGRARMFAALVAGWIRLGVFDDVLAAEEWLRGGLI